MRTCMKNQRVERKRPKKGRENVQPAGTVATVIEQYKGYQKAYRVQLEGGGTDVWYAPCLRPAKVA